ncbi:Cytochrome P450 85A [Senna tora]|uniref:Cytochrome P450 85A n=1 Tax=Senna tora TaxID=362788 RepID=A0A834SL90_9FABA|nr:Cytochrome P450 85A [Senna tora]
MGWPIFGETTEFLKQGPSFMKNQRARFGSFFKSHILGCPTIVSMDAELNRYILMNESKGLVPGYPQSMLDILGKSNIAAVHGSTHKYMRGALLSIISPSMMKHHLLPKIDHFMRHHLSNWDNQVINIQHKTKQMAFLSSLKQIAGIESTSPISHNFMSEFFKLVLGTISLPIDLPGANYRRGVQARKNIVSIVRDLVEERGGFLGRITKTCLKEHMAIRERKKPEDPIDCEDLKSMKFTRADKSIESQSYFLIFGGGTRQCPGKELGIAEICTFLHYFVTRYRWEEVGGEKVMKFPRVEAPNGLHIRVSSY